MKKLIVLSLLLVGCAAPQVLTLKGSYDAIHQKEINKPFDQVWSGVIDVLAQKGLSVKTIDRASGFIISEKVSFAGVFTTEDEKGNLKNPNAYIVHDSKMDTWGVRYAPRDITGTWNIRVKEGSSPSKSIVNVNIVGIDAKIPDLYMDFNAKSTGVFEKWFFAELEK